MDVVITPWLVVQAIKLIAPAGEAGWEQFTSEIGKRVGGGAANLVVDWVRRAAQPERPGETASPAAELVLEMQQQPMIASKLGAEVGRQLGMDLTSREATPPDVAVARDQVVLDAYEAVFWRLAVLAHVEDRPIAFEGALQGGDWTTVCVPSAGIRIGTSKPPAPGDVWTRRPHRKMLQRRDDSWGRAEFFVKRAGSEQATDEAAAINRSFRISGDSGFPPKDQGATLMDRWHRINGIASLWVQLEPDSPARSWIIAHGVDQIDDIDYPRYEMYPTDWKPLLDIPNELEGVTMLGRSADAFAAESAAVKARFTGWRSEPDDDGVTTGTP